MKRILYITGIIAAAFMAFSCEKTPQDGGDDTLNGSFSFTLKVSEVGADYAKINVRHNGPEDVSWYGFITDEVTKSDAKLITEKYNEFLKAGQVKGLKTTKNRTITVDGLESDKKYKYVVFAITSDVKLYNNVDAKSATFTTGVNPYVLTQTDEWKMTRSSQRIDNMEIVSIESTSSSLFVWTYITKEYVESFNKMYPNGLDIEVEGQYMATLDAFQTYIINQIATIQYYVSQGEKLTDFTYSYDRSNPDNNVYQMPRLASGDYYFVAFGFEPDGSHTQTYSVSELVTIEEEASTPGYEAWFGNYTFSGKGFWLFKDDEEMGMKYGDEKDVTYNISIEQLDNNFMYLIKGWECGDDILMDIETEVFEMNKEDGEYLAFIGFYNGGNLEIREITLTNFSDDNATYGFGLCGYAYNEQADAYAPVILEDTPMAMAEPISAGATSTTLNGLNFSFPTATGALDIKYEMMGYLLYDYETLSPINLFNMPVKFPITIEKANSTAASTSASVKQGVMRNLKKSPIGIEPDKNNRPVTYSRR